MELDSQFPNVNSEPIDICSLKNYFLVAYPNFLLLGTPSYSDFKLTFKENSYIKIQPCYYLDWKKSLDSFANKFLNQIDDDDEETVIVNYETFNLSAKFQNKNIIIQINNHPKNKTFFIIDTVEYSQINSAICALFFKPFCFASYVLLTFETIIEVQSLNAIKKVKCLKEAINLVKNMNLFEDESKIIVVANNILRYHSKIILHKEFCKNKFPF